MSWSERIDVIRRAARAVKFDQQVLTDLLSHPQRGRDAAGNELVIKLRRVANAEGDAKRYAPFVVVKAGEVTTETPLAEYAKARQDWAHFLPALMTDAGASEHADDTRTTSNLMADYLKKEKEKLSNEKPLF